VASILSQNVIKRGTPQGDVLSLKAYKIASPVASILSQNVTK
jgi:hypothetical protein